MYKANIGILDESIDNVKKVCEDIKNKDSTFMYEIKRSYLKNFKNVLVIMGDDKEDLEKRAGWFIHKMKNAKVSNYFWIKECNKCE